MENVEFSARKNIIPAFFDSLKLFVDELIGIDIFEKLEFCYNIKMQICQNSQEKFIMLSRKFIEDLANIIECDNPSPSMQIDQNQLKKPQQKPQLVDTNIARVTRSQKKNEAHDILPFYSCRLCYGICLAKDQFLTHSCTDIDESIQISEDFDMENNISTKMHLYELSSFICLICKEKYESFADAKYHLFRCKKSSLRCDICREEFSTKRDLQNHKKEKHKKEKTFACTECKTKFTDHYYLQLHMLCDHIRMSKNSTDTSHCPNKGLPFYCCILCFGVTSDKINFNNHICIDSEKGFDPEPFAEQRLITNVQELRRLNKYICLVCIEEYRSIDRMNYHLPKCKPPPYFCELCKEKFSSKREINYHKKQAHKDTECFFCEECSMRFKFRTSLQKHQVNRHETVQGPFHCDVSGCSAMFHKRLQLTNHKISNHDLNKTFLCDICGKNFFNPCSLKAHVRKHDVNHKFVCRYCEKPFKQKEKCINHERIHTGEKPYECPECDKYFVSKAKLNEHCKRHSIQKPESSATVVTAVQTKMETKEAEQNLETLFSVLDDSIS